MLQIELTDTSDLTASLRENYMPLRSSYTMVNLSQSINSMRLLSALFLLLKRSPDLLRTHRGCPTCVAEFHDSHRS